MEPFALAARCLPPPRFDDSIIPTLPVIFESLAFREDPESFRRRRAALASFWDAPDWKNSGAHGGKGSALSFTCASLVGCDGEEAWTLREEILREYPGWKSHIDIGLGLAGLESERAWDMRERCLRLAWEHPASQNDAKKRGAERILLLGNSLAGCDSPRAWEIREMLADPNEFRDSDGTDPIHPSVRAKALAVSLVGLCSERAWRIRDGFDAEQLPPSMRHIFSVWNNETVFYHWRLGLSEGV